MRIHFPKIIFLQTIPRIVRFYGSNIHTISDMISVKRQDSLTGYKQVRSSEAAPSLPPPEGSP
jgi:hypothetical protein